MNLTRTLAAAAALMLLGATAQAKVLAANNYPLNFSYAVNGTLIPITTTGATTISFNVAKEARYVITFSAECSANAPAGNESAWVDIDLIVNGVVVAPTVGTSDAFCSSNGSGGFGHWAHPSITTVVRLPVGTSTIQVNGKFQGGATGGWVSDSSIVVHD